MQNLYDRMDRMHSFGPQFVDLTWGAGGRLSQLEESLIEAQFDLYAAADGGPFQQLDLTLSLDDRDNALPPTRIRFSLTESDLSEVSS